MEQGKISGVVLCGGKSSRMGQDKAELLCQGKTLLEYQVEKLRALGIEDILLSCDTKRRSTPEGFLFGQEMRARIVPDIYPNRGPLGGIYACLRAAREPRCLVIAVDMPLLPEDILRALIQHHLEFRPDITVLNDQPLVSIYEATLAPKIESLILEKGRAVRALLDMDNVSIERVPYCGAKEGLLNCNTPEDYQLLCKAVDACKHKGEKSWQ